MEVRRRRGIKRGTTYTDGVDGALHVVDVDSISVEYMHNRKCTFQPIYVDKR